MKIVRAIKTNRLGQKFGDNFVPYYRDRGLLGHQGWDWGAKDGEPIYWDCLDVHGKVIVLHTDKSGGLGVIIVSSDSSGSYRHRFWHLKSFGCAPGDILSTGDLIGYADNTGKSTGTHLHRDIKGAIQDRDGNWISTNKDNGYLGAIDIQQFWESNIFVKTYMANLTGQLNILKKVILIIRNFIKKWDS